MTNTTDLLRTNIREHYLANESQIIRELMNNARMTVEDRQQISLNAAKLVTRVPHDSSPSMMEKFLGEYGLTPKRRVPP